VPNRKGITVTSQPSPPSQRREPRLNSLVRASRIDQFEPRLIYKVKAGDYKQMNKKLYYISTLVLFALEAIVSCFNPPILMVFNFIAAISVSVLSLVLPAVFFLAAHKKHSSQFDIRSYKCEKFLSYTYIILGFLAFVEGVTVNILVIIDNKN